MIDHRIPRGVSKRGARGMKIRINKDILAALKPCDDRWKNYLKHYTDFDGDILEFLALEKVSVEDKIWVSVRVMPRFLVEVFAIDCAAHAAAAYASNVAAYAANVAAYAAAAVAAAYAANYADANAAANAAAAAAYAANYAANYAAKTAIYAYAERERQLDAIAYLVSTYKEQGDE